MTAPTTPTTGAPSAPPTPAPTPPSPPAPAPPGAPGSEQPELPIAATESYTSYASVFSVADDGSATTASTLNATIDLARNAGVGPEALTGIVRAVVEARPSSWDALADLVYESAGHHAIPFETVEQMLNAFREHLTARDSFDQMKDDLEFRAALAGQRGERARRVANARIADAARALGRG